MRRSIAFSLALLLFVACGGSGGPTGTPPAGEAGGGGRGGTQPVPTEPEFSFPDFSFPPVSEPTWPPVNGLVRVINIYFPGNGAPFPIDVRQYGFGAGSDPLATVAPESASDYFDPGDSGDGSAELRFLKSGSTDQVDQVMAQGWSNMAGRQVSMIVESNQRSGVVAGKRTGGATYVVEERGGTNPRATPVPSKGLLWIDTQPFDEELDPSVSWPAPAVGLGDGTCLESLEDAGGQAGFSFIVGQHSFALPPGKVKLFVYRDVNLPTSCTGTPVFGPVDVSLDAGKETDLIFYATDKGEIRTLALPIR